MPKITPGQQTPGQNGAPRLYGIDKTENAIPFQEKLMRLFKPQEFVTIMNIDDEPIFWQYMPAENETENFSEDGMQKQVNREAPEMWVIPAGDTEVLVGASAYRALDVMYKAWSSKTTLRKFSDPSAPQFNKDNEHMPKNFNFADGGAQDLFIERAFLGKAMPSFGPQAPALAPHPAFEQAPAPQSLAVDPTIPVPKTTVGAPLQAPAYAAGDLETANDEAVTAAKEIVNAGSTKN